MKATLLLIGKTDQAYLETGIELYINRLKHYLPFEIKLVQALKNTKSLSECQQKQKEGELLLAQLQSTDTLVLLDENSKEFSSLGFAAFVEKQMIGGTKNLVFAVGGPYGFSPEMHQRAQAKISLSKMTFSHQMVRLIFVEQLYRAMTILKGEPYHHQ